MLEKALKKWNSLKREERLFPETNSPKKLDDFRWENKFPADGLVLRVSSRDLPRENAEHEEGYFKNAWNTDFAWFTKAEMLKLIPAKHEKGATHEIPAPIVQRLVRLHLVDNVRGQTPSFSKSGIKQAQLQVEVTDSGPDQISLRLTGSASVNDEGKWAIGGLKDPTESAQKRGFEGKLLGRAVYSTKEQRFTAFEMLAIGSRWGATKYNGRSKDLGPAPQGFAFTLAGASPSERVAPANIWDYEWDRK